MLLGKCSLLCMGEYRKNNLAFWSHWSWEMNWYNETNKKEKQKGSKPKPKNTIEERKTGFRLNYLRLEGGQGDGFASLKETKYWKKNTFT